MGKFITNGKGFLPEGLIFSGKKDGDNIIIDSTKKVQDVTTGEKFDISEKFLGGVITTIPADNVDRYYTTTCKVLFGVGAIVALVGGFCIYKKVRG